jgi:hypothetical protein
MSSGADLDRARELAAKLEAEGIRATVDPRSATPPCVLVTPPNMRRDLACAHTAEWQLWALAPATANADAWAALGVLLDAIDAALDWTRADFASYSLSPDSPPMPAYRVTFEEGI